MNTIEDLRATLHGHADEIEHDAFPARAAGVRQRVAVSRRRRRAAVAGAVAAVLAVVGGVALLPARETPDPAADRQLAGQTAPETIDSLGYTFRFERGYEGEGQRRVRVDASDGPLIVSWAASGDGLRLRTNLATDGDPSLSSKAGASDFSEWSLVLPGQRGWIDARAKSGDVALAVYTLDQVPPGVTKDGMTYRQETPDGSLIAAAIGDQGQTEVSLRVTLPEGRIGFDSFCSAQQIKVAHGLAPNVEWFIDGKVFYGSESCNGPDHDYDLYSGVQYSPGGGIRLGKHRYEAGDTVTVTARLVTEPGDAQLVDDPQARLGFAFYSLADGNNRREQGGHVYQRIAGPRPVVSGATITIDVPDVSVPVIPVVTVPADGFQTWEIWVDGDLDHTFENGLGEAVSLTISTIEPGQSRRVELRLASGTLPDEPVRARYFERID
ncbi:hypothetical protein [Nocardioides sp.]|uniref:hypothetical protein n=1 Tax=Nocardioides sp. TaxID=35761 RepID=UPI003527386A